MPWKECTVMSSRREVVELARQGTVPVRELSRRFEVSCKTIYKWIKRFKAQGLAGLVDQSRRPRSSSVRTPEKMEESVVQCIMAATTLSSSKPKHLADLPYLIQSTPTYSLECGKWKLRS